MSYIAHWLEAGSARRVARGALAASLMFIVLGVPGAQPALANHESLDVVLGQFRRFTGRLHALEPAPKVKALPMATDSATGRRIADTVQALLRQDGLGVVVIENGEIVAEGYANGASATLPTQSYSAAKSLTALAVGEALCAGKVKSLDETAATYAPAIAGTAYGAASLRHLLEYRSGAQDPGGDGYTGVHDGREFSAMVQYKLTLVDLMKKYGEPGRFKAGEKFIYNGLDSEALSVVLRGATGQPLPRWFQETVWQKSGGEHPAGWMIDREGNGVAEVQAYFTTRDYARIGLYALERLAGRSEDACMNAFVKEAAATRIPKGYWDSAPFWGLGMHTGADGNLWFLGHSGQRIGINLQKNRVVAATGYRDSRSRDNLAQELLRK